MMRCFIAVDLPLEVKDYLFRLQREFSKFIKAKWVEKKNIHLTLKFIGEIDEKKLNILKKELYKIKFKKFNLSLGNIGVFPDEKSIKIIWVGLVSNEVIELQKKVDENLLELFSKDQKFVSHITLGRVKAIKNKEKLKEFLNKFKIKKIEFNVDSFKLYRSELTKDRPKYSILEEFSLE